MNADSQAQHNQLKKLSGVVENLHVEKGYQDLIFNKTDSQVAGVAAIGAAALGQAARATGLSNASAGAGAEVSMDFFACTVDGKALRGAFHKVEFVNGDQIEFVIEPEGDFFTVHAARSPAARMLWMSQHQIRGIRAQKACDIRWSVMYPMLAVIGVAIADFFIDKNFGRYSFSEELMSYSLVFFATFVITVWIRSRFRGFAPSHRSPACFWL